MKKLLTIFLITALMIPGLNAEQEVWESVSFIPQDDLSLPSNIGIWEGKLVAFGYKNYQPYLASSVDGNVWTPFPASAILNMYGMSVHSKALYLFGQVSNNRVIERSTDGITWQTIWSYPIDPVTVVYPQALCSYGGYVYALISNGTLIRNNGVDTTWEAIQTLSISANSLNQFIVYRNYLHVVSTHYDYALGKSIINFHRTKNGQSWELAASLEGDLLPSIPIVCQNQLYIFGNQSVRGTTSDNVPYVWEEDTSLGIGGKRPFIAFDDRLHVSMSGKPIYFLGKDGQWKQSVSSPVGATFFTSSSFLEAACLGNRAFVAGVAQFTMRAGVTGARVEQFPTTPLYAGDVGNSLLISFAVNLIDDVRPTLVNLGTLPSKNVDYIEIVKNYFPSSGSAASTPGTMMDLTDKGTWVARNAISIENGDRLFFRVKIKPEATPGTTFIPVIPTTGLACRVNPTFASDGALTSGQAQEIKAGASGMGLSSIDGVLIAPNPGRDQFSFFYDLAQESDVSVKIYDRNGVLVSEIRDPGKSAGNRAFTKWDASQKAPGIYYAVVKIGNDRTYKRKIVIER